MDAVGILVGLLFAFIVYIVAAAFLPYPIPLILAVLVILAAVTGRINIR